MAGVKQPTIDPLTNTKFFKKFHNSFIPEPNSGCFLWIASTEAEGYGITHFNGRSHKAHRIALYLDLGELPASTFVCHKCDNRCCVNPRHLFVGDNRANMLDMYAKKRRINTGVRGVKNHASKLTEKQVREIRQMGSEGATHADIAKLFGCSRENIRDIVNGKRWRWMKSGTSPAKAEKCSPQSDSSSKDEG